MVDSIGQGGSLAREAILAAMKSRARAAEAVRPDSLPKLDAEQVQHSEADFAAKLQEGLLSVDADVKRAEDLPADMVTGRVDDFHEVAVQLKKSEIGFRFAMEVRNKLIDAYREVMRMNV